MVACRLFTLEEFRAEENARMAAVNGWRAAHPGAGSDWPAELSAINAKFFPPGSMWFCPWYHDPEDPDDLAAIDGFIAALKAGGRDHFLSIHYLETWARIRPPITVVCPGGGHWCVDQGSSNGTGWTVTGDAPTITCSPSIWCGQGKGPPTEYHGWLRNGVFAAA